MKAASNEGSDLAKTFAELGGLTSNEVRRLVADVSAVVDVVGLTIGEFIPRQVIRLQQVLRNFPLI